MTRSCHALRPVLALTATLQMTACFARANVQLATLPTVSSGTVDGVYCYRGPYENVTPATPDGEISARTLERLPNYHRDRRESGFTALPLRDVVVNSPVSFTRTGDRLEIRFSARASGRPRTLAWRIKSERDGVLELELPKVGGGAVLGIGWSRRWADVTRGVDGRLALVEHYRERGLGLLVIPFQDHLVWRMDLDPESSCSN